MFHNPFNKHAAHEHPAEHKEETPFASILSTPALRIEFTLLVMLCADHMRSDLSSVFDPTQIRPPSKPSAALEKSSEWQHHSESQDSSNDLPQPYHETTEGQGSSDYDYSREELATPEMKALQRDSLASFNKWRVSVLKRLGEVLDVHAEAVKQARHDREHNLTTNINQFIDTKTTNSPIHTVITDLPESQRILLLESLLLLFLSLETYSAYSRILLLRITASLSFPAQTLAEKESAIAKTLLATASTQLSAEEETKRNANKDSSGRAWKVGLATVAGAALIGVTGGLAAPLIAAGFGTVLGGLGLGATAAAGLLGSLAGNVVIIGGLFGAYGGKMTGQMIEKYAREVRDFKFIPLREVAKDEHQLRVMIGISGWLREEAEVVKPWMVLGGDAEGFALRWEVEALMAMGHSMESVLKGYVWSYAKAEVIKRTLFAGLAAGLWPLGLLRICRVLDNPFTIAKSRSDKAGRILADSLINKAQGERPVTLVGYSLGARVIFACLQSLAERKAFGLVESVVLLGAPVPSDSSAWRRIRAVVSGRVINAYSKNDFILSFLYRTSSYQYGVAGLREVEDVYGVENFNASELVSGHTRYRYLVGSILGEIGFEPLDMDAVHREAETLKKIDRLEEEERKQKEAKEGTTAPQAKGADDHEIVDLNKDEVKASEVDHVQRQAEKLTIDSDADKRPKPEIVSHGDSRNPEKEDAAGEVSDAEPKSHTIMMHDLE